MKEKSKNWLKSAYIRYLHLIPEDLRKSKDVQLQFTYMMSGDLYKKKMRDKGFVPYKVPKMTRKMIRTGRLA
jgi:hypothetical protein